MDFIDFKAEILLKEVGNDPIKKAEAIRDIVKSVGFVQNALKREVYLKEVSNKFGLSEQSFSMSWMFKADYPESESARSAAEGKCSSCENGDCAFG
jgi:hypothetical protein